MKENVEALSKQLGEDVSNSAEVCRKLCLIPELDSFEVLINLATHKDPYHRRLSALYLNEHPFADHAVPQLLELLHDNNKYVVSAATESLISIHHRQPSLLKKKEISVLLYLFHTGEVHTVCGAAKILGILQRQELHQQFLKMLESEIPELKCAAIEAIGNLNNKQDFEQIFNLYKDPKESKQVREIAATSSLHLVSHLTWRNFFETFKDDDQLKYAALEILKRFASHEDVAYLAALKKDSDLGARLAASEVLHTLRGESLDLFRLSKRNSSQHSKKGYPKTIVDGSKVLYKFCENEELNDRVTSLIHEAREVFSDGGGAWKTFSKDHFAKQIVEEMNANSWLGPRMLALKDRLISMLVYRAYEILNNNEGLE